ncbi:hypothetical protein chiPu_0028799, partial [Chiloscyllium punctatum]|nr:hypothetical protein [Chiloscyllium punctatum]
QPPSPGLTLGLSDPPSPPPAAPAPSSSSSASSATSLCPGLRLLSPSEGGGAPPLVDPGPPEAYPHGAALRNDLGSNISVLKTLNLRFRCFLAKVHGLERRNRALEAELLRERTRSGPGEDARPPAPATRDRAVQTGPDRPQASGLVANPGLGGVARPQASGLGSGPGLGGLARPQASGLVANPGLGGVARPQASGLVANPGLGGVARPQASGLGWNPGLRGVARPQASGLGWGLGADGVGVQTDTVTPELRALHNVLANVKRERDELRVR